MSDCCTHKPVRPQTARGADPEHCPACGQRGKSVNTLTIKALLNVTLETLRPVKYRFCESPDCPTVYFAEDGCSQTIGEDQLRVRVHQKHPDNGDVPACYCFFHSSDSIRAELNARGYTDVIERVTALTKVDACACDIRNPQGSCCLGNLRRVVKAAMGAPEPVAMRDAHE